MRREIVQNKARCKACGTVLRSLSSNQGETLWCGCGAIGISGGLEHLRRYGDLELVEELSLELVDGQVVKVEPAREQPHRTYDGDDLEKWKAMPYRERKAAMRARAWLPQPPMTDIKLEYGIVRDGEEEVECRWMPSLETAVKEARRRYIDAALDNTAGEDAALMLTSVFEVTVRPVPFMAPGVLEDDGEDAVCPRCKELVTKAELCDELGLCTRYVKSILEEREKGREESPKRARKRPHRDDGRTGPAKAGRIIRSGEWLATNE